MSRIYTCSNCRHSGHVAEENPASKAAEPTCAQCGAKVDTIAVAGRDEITNHGERPRKTATPPAIEIGHGETVDWKSEAAHPTIPGYEALRESSRGGMGVA